MIVVLAILKWIGIILLSIVGLLLFFVVLLLFVPVRYVAVAEYEECFQYAFRVGWLFPLFYIRKSMKKQDIFLYVLGIPVKSLSRDGGRKKKQKEEICLYLEFLGLVVVTCIKVAHQFAE